MTFWPPIVCGISAIVFFSGMPSDAAGPVAETVTPTLMSACATLASVARARRGRSATTERCLAEGHARVSVVWLMGNDVGLRRARAPRRGRRRTGRRRPAPCRRGSSSPVGCSQVNIQFIMPNSSIVSGLSRPCRAQLGPRLRRSPRRTRRRRCARRRATRSRSAGCEEAARPRSARGARPARRRRRSRKAVDQAAHARLGRAALARIDLGDQRLQPGDVRLGDLDAAAGACRGT